MSTPCLIALGSNLGDRLANLQYGVSGLAAADGLDITSISGLYETAPVGGPDNQGPYYNAALLAETTLEPAAVLAMLHRLEADRERERVVHWGPRTLDLDLLVYGDVLSDEPTLELPHPRQHLRRFVLVPVCDVAPEMVHPRLGRSMSDLLAALPMEPGDLTLVTNDWQQPTTSDDAT